MWAQYQALNKPVRLHGEDRGRTSSPHARTFNLVNQKRLLKTLTVKAKFCKKKMVRSFSSYKINLKFCERSSNDSEISLKTCF